MCFQFPNVLHHHILLSESQSSQVQLITLKATYLPNILRMRVNLLPT